MQIGFGGGCHWCTEAVFLSLAGVEKVAQGWIASAPPNDAFSEAVVVSYDSSIISLQDLIGVHLHTHASTSLHGMRAKYRSAVYWFHEADETKIKLTIEKSEAGFEQRIITQVLPFVSFKASLPEHWNYYYSNPEKPFCTVYINPKLQMLKNKYPKLMNANPV